MIYDNEILVKVLASCQFVEGMHSNASAMQHPLVFWDSRVISPGGTCWQHRKCLPCVSMIFLSFDLVWQNAQVWTSLPGKCWQHGTCLPSLAILSFFEIQLASRCFHLTAYSGRCSLDWPEGTCWQHRKCLSCASMIFLSFALIWQKAQLWMPLTDPCWQNATCLPSLAMPFQLPWSDLLIMDLDRS